MAKKRYDKIDSFNKKLEKMVEGLNREELFWVLKSLGSPLDAQDALINKVAERLMAGDLIKDELLIVAESPVHLGKDAAKKILENNPSDAQLSRLMMKSDLLGWEIANQASKMMDDRLFAGTTIREDMEKLTKK